MLEQDITGNDILKWINYWMDVGLVKYPSECLHTYIDWQTPEWMALAVTMNDHGSNNNNCRHTSKRTEMKWPQSYMNNVLPLWCCCANIEIWVSKMRWITGASVRAINVRTQTRTVLHVWRNGRPKDHCIVYIYIYLYVCMHGNTYHITIRHTCTRLCSISMLTQYANKIFHVKYDIITTKYTFITLKIGVCICNWATLLFYK